jgi:hypothetical protein
VIDLSNLESRIAALENKSDYNDYGSDFLRFGKDISTIEYTSIVIALVDGTYNGESLTAGDIIIGNHDAFNLKFGATAGTWDFREGTSIIVARIGFDLSTNSRADEPLEVEVTSGDVDIDIRDADGYEHSYIVITASTGAFRLSSIRTSQQDGKIVDIHNDSANNMTIGNNVYSGSPPTGHTSIFTLTGADIGPLTTFSYASFRFKETLTVSGTQYFLRSYNG